VPPSRTITFGAGARSHDTNRATSSTRTSAQSTPTVSRNSNHNFKLVAYARCVFGDLSNAARYVRNESADSIGDPSPPRTVHDSDSETGITTRCTAIAEFPEPVVNATYDQRDANQGMVTNALQITRPRRTSTVRRLRHGHPVPDSRYVPVWDTR
jgi:hypothetical protein